MARNETVKEAYVEWLLLTDGQRATSGLPVTEAAFAAAKGVGESTLRRWKRDPAFQENLKSRQQALAVRHSPGLPVTGTPMADRIAAPQGASAAELQFLAAKTVLEDLIASKDKNALDLYFKTFGKSFVEAEQQAHKSDFAALDDTALVTRTLAHIPTPALQAEIDRRNTEETPQ